MNTTAAAAFDLATEIAWNGHTTWQHAMKLGAKAGIAPADVADTIAVAVGLEMLRPVPRLGGYVAGRKVNAKIFGRAFADFMAGR